MVCAQAHETISAEQVSSRCASPDGLTSAEAASRLKRYGPNVLPAAPSLPAWRTLVAQMVHFFALLLWAASGLAVLAGTPELALAIVAIIVINGVFAFVQEHRAERATERLRDLLPRRMTVVRDGLTLEIDAAEAVPDDLALVEAGDRVSADLRVLETHGLTIDNSMLTGESLPTTPEIGASLYAGTFVVEGEGLGRIVATGAATRLGGLAHLTRSGHRPLSPLAHELQGVVRVIAIIAMGVGFAFFGLAVLLGLQPAEGFLFGIGVCVALVPEGLLPTVTLSLAVGAQRMAARHALVRRLESVETLGSTTFICTDKTGTLTRNEMEVVQAWTPSGTADICGIGYEPIGTIEADTSAMPALAALALAAARCSRGRAVQRNGVWAAEGDPMEAALDTFARRLGVEVEADAAIHPVSRRFPFTPHRRRMSLIAGDRLLVKGAPEVVLPLCEWAGAAETIVEDMARRGLRVLAVASRMAEDGTSFGSAEQAEQHLDVLGLVGLEDPPRPGVSESLGACRIAGIRVAMITGDHPDTAAAIGRQLGFSDQALHVDGRQLPQDMDKLGQLLDRDGVIVSRVAPEDKLRIAQALQARGHVVAMTGDGVNDGPALQAADIGVAMGRSGTDVAREAADLVLLDDDFSTILAAVEQGRATFANIRRSLTYHLTDNVAELTPFVVWALSGGRIPLALGVLQILSLDAGTDQLPALGLGIERPPSDVLRQPPVSGHLIDGALLRRVFGVLGPTEALIEMAAFAAVLLVYGWRPDGRAPVADVLLAASGAAFSAVVFGQIGNALACRSARVWPGALGWTTNRFLLWSLLVEVVLLLVLLAVPTFATLLRQAPPPLLGLLIAAAAAPAVVAVDRLHKAWLRHSRQMSSSDGPAVRAR